MLKILFAAAAAVLAGFMPVVAQDERPNVVLILADDMGYSDLGVTGSEISTPNIDKLAADGVLFTRFYNASRCCPTRASLLTGLYQHQTGVGHMDDDKGLPAYQGFLNQQCATIAEVLKANGYATAMTGKWHIGSDPRHWPTERGFDNFFGVPKGGGIYFYPPLLDRPIVREKDTVVPDAAGFYSTDAFSDYAAGYIESRKDSIRPFFLYVAHVAPHFPLQARREDIERHRGKYKAGYADIRRQRFRKQTDLGIVRNRKVLSPTAATRDWDALNAAEQDSADLKMAIYAAQLESMDRGIGRIIGKLQATGQYENTVIIFLSDNGGEAAVVKPLPGATGALGSARSWASYGPEWAGVSNTPFRSFKSWTYEGGIITPMVFHYPRMVTRGKAVAYPGHIIDVMPTILELTKSEYAKAAGARTLPPPEGQSLVPAIRGKAGIRTTPLFWEHQGNRAVRLGNWKIVSSYPAGHWEMYDLAADPTELIDVRDSNPEKLKQLTGLYDEWARRIGVVPWKQIVERKSEQE